MSDFKNLKKYIRNDFDNFIRPVFIKQKCELCESADRLELHHVPSLIIQIKETLTVLNIEIKDDYTSYEEDIIRSYVMSKQIKNSLITYCSKCHKRIHKEGRYFKKSEKKSLELHKVSYDDYIKEMSFKLDDMLKPYYISQKSFEREVFINLLKDFIGEDVILDRVMRHNGKKLRNVSYGISVCNRFLERCNSSYVINSKIRRIKGDYKKREASWYLSIR